MLFPRGLGGRTGKPNQRTVLAPAAAAAEGGGSVPVPAAPSPGRARPRTLGALRGWALVSELSLGCSPSLPGTELAGERGDAAVSHFALL